MRAPVLYILFSLLFTSSLAQRQYGDSLKRALNFAKEDTNKVHLLFNLSSNYLFQYPDTSTLYAKQGLELAEKTGHTKLEIGCLNMLCLSLTNQGNFVSALNFGFKALARSKSINDSLTIAWSYNALMQCYVDQDDYKEALEYGYKAKNFLGSPYHDISQAGTVLGLIGSVYEKAGQPDSALYYLHQSYELSKVSAFKLIVTAEVCFDFGNIYAKKRNYDLALKYYNEGIAIAKEQLTNTALVDIYTGMSKVFETIGKKDSAIYYANKAYLQEGIEVYPEGKLQAAGQLAHLYESSGDADSLIKYLKLSAILKDSLFNRQKIREVQNFAFNDQLRQQELTAQHRQDENRIKMFVLLAVAAVFLITAFVFWRNNKLKQKANALLQEKNAEIESTLKELKLTQAQLIQSEKMASLGELTAGIAHEIQNPLNFVNNFSEVNKELLGELKEEAEKGNLDEVKAIADDAITNEEKINHHGKRADAIVKGMLQHSRSSTGVKEPTDLNALADEYLRLSYHGLRAKDKNFNAEIKTDFDETIEKINIIPQDIGRVLLNLFNNAFYACNERSLRAVNKEKGGNSNWYQPTVWVSTSKSGNSVRITVSDNGTGIPQNIVDKIFQPFFTTKPTGEGTGLGLSLSYDIIKAHGGEIRVIGKEGEGSEFIIELPLQ